MPFSNSKNSLQEFYLGIKDFMAKGQWNNAYRDCLEVLKFDPENRQFLSLKRKIEQMVEKNNQQAVEEDLCRLKPLLKEGKYPQLLEELKKLAPYAPHYRPLKNFIAEVQQTYEQDLKKQAKQYFKVEFSRIQQLFQASDFSKAFIAVTQLKTLGLYLDQLKKFTSKLSQKWIRSELEKNRIFLQGEKYEDILLFYQNLLQIDPTSREILTLMEQTKKRYQYYKIQQQREFTYKSLEHIRILYQLKKYEKSLAASLEILELDPANKEARAFYKNSLRKIAKTINSEVIDQMVNNKKRFSLEYKNDPEPFIRL